MKKRGFTLIELLVTLAIIGILSTIVIGSLQYQRLKARDAKRQMDFDALRKSLELYYTSNNHYPEQDSNCICIEDLTDPDVVIFRSELEGYISYIPGDPIYPQNKMGTTSCYYYMTKNNGRDYKIRTILESPEEYYDLNSLDGADLVMP